MRRRPGSTRAPPPTSHPRSAAAPSPSTAAARWSSATTTPASADSSSPNAVRSRSPAAYAAFRRDDAAVVADRLSGAEVFRVATPRNQYGFAGRDVALADDGTVVFGT